MPFMLINIRMNVIQTLHAAWTSLKLRGIWNARFIVCDLSAENNLMEVIFDNCVNKWNSLMQVIWWLQSHSVKLRPIPYCVSVCSKHIWSLVHRAHTMRLCCLIFWSRQRVYAELVAGTMLCSPNLDGRAYTHKFGGSKESYGGLLTALTGSLTELLARP